MKYATWILKFDDPFYGTGPEETIIAQGGSAEGAYTDGDVSAGAKILGYFTGNTDNLQRWQFQELTQGQALDFVLAINPDAYLLDDGKIAGPVPDFPTPQPD